MLDVARRDIIIVGAGGHARVLIGLLPRTAGQNVYAVDTRAVLHGTALDDIPIIGGEDAVTARAPADVLLVNGHGNNPGGGTSGLDRRRRVFETFAAQGYTFMTVTSSEAFISPKAVVGNGAQVITSAVVHPGARLGANVIINTGAQIDHDCVIGDHCHVAPGAVLCGGVRIEDECHIGAGAIVNARLKIGKGAVVGSGAVVVRDVAPETTVYGNPARARRRSGRSSLRGDAGR